VGLEQWNSFNNVQFNRKSDKSDRKVYAKAQRGVEAAKEFLSRLRRGKNYEGAKNQTFKEKLLRLIKIERSPIILCD
jgi:hypothetical protein